MVPIHDTDLAEDRWAKSEWEHYELWEKIEIKLRRRKWIWIGATVVAFLGLSSVPIVMDRSPKWSALALSRRLAQEINELRKDASLNHEAFRIRFAGSGQLAFVIERMKSCSDRDRASVQVVRSGFLGASASGAAASGDFALLGPKDGDEMGVPGLIESFCYDPRAGSEIDARGEPMAAFAIASAQDVADRRIDRIALLLIRGPGAEPTFD